MRKSVPIQKYISFFCGCLCSIDNRDLCAASEYTLINYLSVCLECYFVLVVKYDFMSFFYLITVIFKCNAECFFAVCTVQNKINVIAVNVLVFAAIYLVLLEIFLCIFVKADFNIFIGGFSSTVVDCKIRVD